MGGRGRCAGERSENMWSILVNTVQAVLGWALGSDVIRFKAGIYSLHFVHARKHDVRISVKQGVADVIVHTDDSVL